MRGDRTRDGTEQATRSYRNQPPVLSDGADGGCGALRWGGPAHGALECPCCGPRVHTGSSRRGARGLSWSQVAQGPRGLGPGSPRAGAARGRWGHQHPVGGLSPGDKTQGTLSKGRKDPAQLCGPAPPPLAEPREPRGTPQPRLGTTGPGQRDEGCPEGPGHARS